MPHPFADLDALYESGLEAAQMMDSAGGRRRLRFYNLLQIFSLSDGIPGNTIEVGCFRGLSSFLLCNAMKRSDPAFTGMGHTMVDSFEGLSAPVGADELPESARGRFHDTSVAHVRSTLKDFPDVRIVKGWVPDVFEKLPTSEYRFVHIDVDLYQPTIDSLNYFYPKVAAGGIVVVDDFGAWPDGGRYPGCTQAVIEFSKRHDFKWAALSTGNAVIFKG